MHAGCSLSLNFFFSFDENECTQIVLARFVFFSSFVCVIDEWAVPTTTTQQGRVEIKNNTTPFFYIGIKVQHNNSFTCKNHQFALEMCV